MAMVVEQDWRPKDLPPLEDIISLGEEPVTLFLPGMPAAHAWALIPNFINVPLTIDLGGDHPMFVLSND